MLHVIAVDDEPAALKWFSRIAANHPNLVVGGLFSSAAKAVAYAHDHEVDAAFLDVEMPEMIGLDLARELQAINPEIRIVFITGHSQYAISAFRVRAFGYLLKPLDPDEFAEQVGHLVKLSLPRMREPDSRRLQVTCFGQFTVRQTEGDAAIRWKTAKAEELFALLVYYQGRSRARDILIDQLWPQLDPDKAANLFRVTCTYIRSALNDLGFTNIVDRELDGYRVNTALLDCDLYRFRQVMHANQNARLSDLEDLASLYGGAYLEGKSYDWATIVQAEFEAAFKRMQRCLAQRCLADGDTARACQALEKILAADPCDEEAMLEIIELQLQNGEPGAARKRYNMYQTLLDREYGELPPVHLRSLFDDRGGQA
ncbi:MAG: response regulator [Clostridiaceae bacterium]|nr:response regulator [Eubacteriales bacterium]MDD4141008.1 response regulator [Eubacteriales bacterium]NLB45929.1 response regulator [Clostridiaceae bacterium]